MGIINSEMRFNMKNYFSILFLHAGVFVKMSCIVIYEHALINVKRCIETVLCCNAFYDKENNSVETF